MKKFKTSVTLRSHLGMRACVCVGTLVTLRLLSPKGDSFSFMSTVSNNRLERELKRTFRVAGRVIINTESEVSGLRTVLTSVYGAHK